MDIDNNSGNSAGEASGLSAVATIGISFGAVLIVLVLAFVGYRFYLSSNSKTPLAAAEGAPVAGVGAGLEMTEERDWMGKKMKNKMKSVLELELELELELVATRSKGPRTSSSAARARSSPAPAPAPAPAVFPRWAVPRRPTVAVVGVVSLRGGGRRPRKGRCAGGTSVGLCWA